MTRSRTVALLAIAVLSLAAAEAAAGIVEETLDQTLPFAAGNRLEVSNINGEIEVRVWDREEIRIEAVKKARASTDDRARETLANLRVTISKTTGGVSIDTVQPRGEGGWWGRASSVSVDYTLHVPRRGDLDLRTVNGNLTVRGTHGNHELQTTNGGISVQRSGGRVEARTTNGGIDVELEEVADGASLSFRTTNGGITLTVPADIKASLTARTTNGSISSELPVSVVGSSTRRRLEGDINGGGGRIELHTTNGGIRLREL